MPQSARPLLVALALLLTAPAAAAPIFGVREDLPGPINPLEVVIADLNDDGTQDLVVSSPGSPPSQGQLSTWFGRGDGYFYAGPASACLREPTHLLTARFDGDAFADVAMTVSFISTGEAVEVLRARETERSSNRP
jgi:hypothetical protein